MTKYLKLLRVEQWVKNFFVFAPLFFSGNITNIDLLIKSLFAFAVFSLAASAVYILNDYSDIESDKKILVGFAKQAIKNNGHTNIDYESKSLDDYELFVTTLFVNDVEQSVIDFFMGEDEFRACYILDVEELKM